MQVLAAPDLPELRPAYRCGMCGGVVRFEPRDLGARALRFHQNREGWQVRTNCPCCRAYAVFTETEYDGG